MSFAFSNDKNDKYRLIAQFDDSRYATLKIGSFIVSNFSNECVKSGNVCNLDLIKQGMIKHKWCTTERNCEIFLAENYFTRSVRKNNSNFINFL